MATRMDTEQRRIRATLITLSLCACGGLLLAGCGGGTSQSSINQPVSSESSHTPQPVSSGANPVPTISTLSPSCAPAGEQFVDSVGNQLTVIGTTVGSNFVAGLIVGWDGTATPPTPGR